MSYKKTLLAGIIFLFSVNCFYSCAKEDVYKAVVTVSRIEETGDSHTRIPVPDCRLIFGEDNFDETIRREVYTDAMGKYTGEWKREVSLKIQASKEINGEMYTGASVVRLSLIKTAEVEVLVTLEK